MGAAPCSHTPMPVGASRWTSRGRGVSGGGLGGLQVPRGGGRRPGGGRGAPGSRTAVARAEAAERWRQRWGPTGRHAAGLGCSRLSVIRKQNGLRPGGVQVAGRGAASGGRWLPAPPPWAERDLHSANRRARRLARTRPRAGRAAGPRDARRRPSGPATEDAEGAQEKTKTSPTAVSACHTQSTGLSNEGAAGAGGHWAAAIRSRGSRRAREAYATASLLTRPRRHPRTGADKGSPSSAASDVTAVNLGCHYRWTNRDRQGIGKRSQVPATSG